MIYVFRILVIFCMLNLINLYLFNGGAGMEPVWILLIIIFTFLSFSKPYSFFISKGWFKFLFISLFVIFLFVESLIIINGFKTDINYKSDYLIILGARVKGTTPTLALQYRLEKGYEYLVNHPEAKAILSGGQGPGEDITEAEAMRRYLAEKGIDEKRIVLEDQSSSTVENITNSFKILDQMNPDATITIVTSRFHVLRSKMIANHYGRRVEGIGVKTMQFLIPNYYLREFFAVVKDFILLSYYALK